MCPSCPLGKAPRVKGMLTSISEAVCWESLVPGDDVCNVEEIRNVCAKNSILIKQKWLMDHKNLCKILLYV